MRKIAEAFGILAVATAVSCLFQLAGLTDTNIVMAYLIGVVLIAMRTDMAVGVCSSAVSVLLFNFFFIAPRFTLVVYDTQYLFTFAVMLAVTMITSALTSRIKSQGDIAVEREARTAALYQLSRALLESGDGEEILAVVQERIGKTLRGTARVVPEGGDDEPPVNTAGRFVVPLDGVAGKYGNLVFERTERGAIIQVDDRSLLEAFAAQLVLALDRERSNKEHERARVRAETERNRMTILRSISHDLRTPLASIAGASSTLMEEYGELEEDTRRELLSGIYEEATWLAEVVENLLSLNRLQNPNVLIRKTSEVIDDVLYSAVQRTRNRLRDHSLTVESPEDLILVPMDGTLVEQALVNIIDNAIRHTPDGTHIRVKAEMIEGGTEVEFSIEDDGPGITASLLPALFSAYGTASVERTRGKGGAGLGLGICKAIVEAHGGNIQAENRSGGGTRISFTLPSIGGSPT
jgi:two-component system sensor histidine kinase KdpD